MAGTKGRASRGPEAAAGQAQEKAFELAGLPHTRVLLTAGVLLPASWVGEIVATLDVDGVEVWSATTTATAATSEGLPTLEESCAAAEAGGGAPGRLLSAAAAFAHSAVAAVVRLRVSSPGQPTPAFALTGAALAVPEQRDIGEAGVVTANADDFTAVTLQVPLETGRPCAVPMAGRCLTHRSRAAAPVRAACDHRKHPSGPERILAHCGAAVRGARAVRRGHRLRAAAAGLRGCAVCEQGGVRCGCAGWHERCDVCGQGSVRRGGTGRRYAASGLRGSEQLRCCVHIHG
jgi:hypothetical protein